MCMTMTYPTLCVSLFYGNFCKVRQLSLEVMFCKPSSYSSWVRQFVVNSRETGSSKEADTGLDSC